MFFHNLLPCSPKARIFSVYLDTSEHHFSVSGSKLIPRDPSREEETPFGKSWIEPGLGWNVAQLPVVSSNRGPFSFSSDSKHELLNSPRLQNGVKTLSFEFKKRQELREEIYK